MNLDRSIRRGSRALAVITLGIGAAACGTVARSGPATESSVPSSRPAHQLSGSIQEFPLSAAQTSPRGRTLGGLTMGPDGALWFTETVTDPQSRTPTGKIGRMTSTGTVTEYPLVNEIPKAITTGPDGNLWFTESGLGPGYGTQGPGGKIGRITPTGQLQQFTLPNPGTDVQDITAGPDDALWFTEGRNDAQTGQRLSAIGRITTNGNIREFPLSKPNVTVTSITTGPDHALWFSVQVVEPQAGATPEIGHLTPSGVLSFFPTKPMSMFATEGIGGGLVFGPDGNLWFLEITRLGLAIGRMTPRGAISQFPLTSASQSLDQGSPLGAITAGKDSALWFTDTGGNAIDRISTSGTFTRYSLPDPHGDPVAIVCASDGTLWFTEPGAWKVGHLQ